jgi:GNAT superfamily N-acetyltransferase
MTEDTRRGVRRATAADRAELARVLADAFADDAVFTRLFPPTTTRRESRLRRMFALEAARSEQYGGTWISGDGAGGAVWFPPGRWKATRWENLRDAPRWMALFGRELRFGQQAQEVRKDMEAHHRELPPHWYLLYIVVEPARQGRGLGGALLRPVLEECDRTGTPAYLEASCERNRALYARHGFVERDPLPLPGGGPTMFPMWRDPA